MSNVKRLLLPLAAAGGVAIAVFAIPALGQTTPGQSGNPQYGQGGGGGTTTIIVPPQGTTTTTTTITTTTPGTTTTITTPAPPKTGKRFPAKLQIYRAGIKGTRLDVLGQITARASGVIKATFVNNGTTTQFTVGIPSTSPRYLRINRFLPKAARKGKTGILTLDYNGDSNVRADSLRLRVATNKALLKRQFAQITSAGNLRVGGTISSRAVGVVRIRLVYTDSGGDDRTLNYRATISHGTWSINEKLPADAARAVGETSIQYTGYLPRRIRGEQDAKQVIGNG